MGVRHPLEERRSMLHAVAVVTGLLVVAPSESAPSSRAAAAAPLTPRIVEPQPFVQQTGTAVVIDASFVRRAEAAGSDTIAPLVLGDGEEVLVKLTPFRVVADEVEVRVGARSNPQLATT